MEINDSLEDLSSTPGQRFKSSILSNEERQSLLEPYLAQTVALLCVAVLGAFTLLSINIVGILICKRYFRKRQPQSAVYLNSLSYSRRCRYSTLLRRFSLDGQQSISDNSGVNQEVRNIPGTLPNNIKDLHRLPKYLLKRCGVCGRKISDQHYDGVLHEESPSMAGWRKKRCKSECKCTKHKRSRSLDDNLIITPTGSEFRMVDPLSNKC